MSDKARTDIIGPEGLASTVAALASQVSAIEKNFNGSVSNIRSELDLRFDKTAAELRRVEDVGESWRANHIGFHAQEAKALDEAKEVERHWRDNANEWRAESQQRQETYATIATVTETFRGVKDIVARNESKADLDVAKLDARLEAVERFTGDIKAQMGTLRALMVVILFALTVAGFIIGMRQ